MAKALKHHLEAIVITKIGLDINETDKIILGESYEPEFIIPAIEGCLMRLERDTIDLMLLHPNEVPVSSAALVFQEMDGAIKELLQVGGRSLVQGALGWLWGRSVTNIPVPGARTVHQVEELAAALHTGPLPEDVMLEIDALIGGNNMSLGDEPR